MNSNPVCSCGKRLSLEQLSQALASLSDADRARVIAASQVRAVSSGPVGHFEVIDGKPVFDLDVSRLVTH